MELCDLSLHDYIHRADTPRPSESIPYFIKDAPPEIKASQIWNIMRDIAEGLLYIHEHSLVHRDVKPLNGKISVATLADIVVLYSRKDSVWKLVDFGLTSVGTSREVHSTIGRGTSGYRAPELVSGSKGVYNNKVDIWSMGCILYELAVGRRAFCDDWTVIQHMNAGKDLEPDVDETFGEQFGGEITENILLMLRIDPESRPSATDLFNTICRLCRPTNTSPLVDRRFQVLQAQTHPIRSDLHLNLVNH